MIDSDGRDAEELKKLQEKGVFAVDAYSVESIYYHELVQEIIAKRRCSALGGDASEKLAIAKQTALKSLEGHVKRLSLRIAEKEIRFQVAGLYPTKEQMENGDSVTQTVDCGAILNAEEQRLKIALDAGELQKLIRRYPLRESPALEVIATKLGFSSREDYEAAVRHALGSDVELLELVRSFFSKLVATLEEDE